MIAYRARYYDPSEGRFLSEDPIGFSGGDWNLYRYTINSPLIKRDPSGNFPILSVVIGIAGGILGTYLQDPNASIGDYIEGGFIGGITGLIGSIRWGQRAIGGIVGGVSNLLGQINSKKYCGGDINWTSVGISAFGGYSAATLGVQYPNTRWGEFAGASISIGADYMAVEFSRVFPEINVRTSW